MADARKTPETGSAASSRGQFDSQAYDSAERLRDQLMDYVRQTDAKDIDVQKVDAMLARINELDPQEKSGLSAPEETGELQDPAGPDINSSNRTRFSLRKLLIVAAALITALALFGVQFAVGDRQEAKGTSDGNVFQLTATQKPEYALVRNHPLEEGETKTYDSVEDMLEDFGIDARVVPTKVPERLGEPVVQAAERKQGLRLSVDYEGNEFLSMYHSEILASNNKSTETNQIDAVTELINGIPHFIVIDKEITKIVWINGELECHLSSDLPYEDVIEVLYSIYED